MKKIALMLAVAAFAVGSASASTFKWTSTGTTTNAKKFYGSDGNAITVATVAYLFDSGVVSQSKLLTDVRNGSSIDSFTKVATGTIGTDSRFTAVDNISYGTTGTTYDFYMAIVSGDNILISSIVSGDAQAADTTTIAFTNPGTWTKTKNADAAWGSSGWYATPEPTSGLLLLLGVAGLALKRKQI